MLVPPAGSPSVEQGAEPQGVAVAVALVGQASLQATPRATIAIKMLNRALAYERFHIFRHSSFEQLPMQV